MVALAKNNKDILTKIGLGLGVSKVPLSGSNGKHTYTLYVIEKKEKPIAIGRIKWNFRKLSYVYIPLVLSDASLNAEYSAQQLKDIFTFVWELNV